MLKISFIDLQLGHFDFFLLVLSSVFIAAAGYIINDYFDTKIDQVNRPKNVVVGILIKRRVAMGGHIVLTVLGIMLGFYVAYKVGVIKLGLVHFIAAGILWFYSTDFKSQSFTGNFMVAILTAMVPMLVPLYEIPLLNREYEDILIETGTNFNFLYKFIGGFAFFAFLLTLIREIVKDIEDYKGDEEFGLRTLPIAYGIGKAKRIAFWIIGVTVLGLGILQFRQVVNGDYLSFLYLLLVLQLPILYMAFRLNQASTPEEYHAVSLLAKLIMGLGILYSVLIYVILSDLDLSGIF